MEDAQRCFCIFVVLHEQEVDDVGAYGVQDMRICGWRVKKIKSDIKLLRQDGYVQWIAVLERELIEIQRSRTVRP